MRGIVITSQQDVFKWIAKAEALLRQSPNNDRYYEATLILHVVQRKMWQLRFVGSKARKVIYWKLEALNALADANGKYIDAYHDWHKMQHSIGMRSVIIEVLDKGYEVHRGLCRERR